MTDANLLQNGFLSAIKHSKWKESSQRGLLDILSMVFDISDELKNKTYVSHRQTTFTLHERGRVRIVDSYNIRDRTIRHVLCDEILSPIVRNKIIYDNGASVSGRGISFSRKRFEVHLKRYYVQHETNNGYILFGDFSKYYDNILHDVAKKQFLELVDNDSYIEWLLNTIFKAFEVNVDGLSDEEIQELYNGVLNKLEYNPDNYKASSTIKKSVSIGDQLSQLIGIYYPHELDNYIKIVCGQKYYGRYMDDWYIMSDSKKELELLLANITKKAAKLGLTVNSKKTRIVKMSSTYKFLQIKYSLTSTGKIIKRINPKRIVAMRKKLKKLAKRLEQGSVLYDNIENMFKSWMGGHYKLMSKDQRSGLISLYEDLFNKRIYIRNHKMIILKEGSE